MRVLQFARLSAALLALASTALAGCGRDSTAPDAPFDAGGTSADVEAVAASFEAPAMESYAAMSAEIGAAVGGSAAAAVRSHPTAAIASGKPGALRYAASLGRTYEAGRIRPSFSAAPIPAEYAGTTFAYDVATSGYVASDLTGAPESGVRFLLYAVNPVHGVPVEPLSQVGYADITASETGSTSTVRIVVVSGGETYLDYAVAATESSSAVSVTVTGFATNGTDRANFDLDNRVTGSLSSLDVVVDYLLTIPTRGNFRIEMEAGTEDIFSQSPTTTLGLEARGEHGTVGINGSMAGEAGSFNVQVNGNLFATITLNGNAEPVVTGAGGQPLTEEELATVRAVFAIFIEGGDIFEDLTDPLS